MAGKKENPVETAEETGITGTATAEMATMEMAAEIPITREEAGTRAESTDAAETGIRHRAKPD